MAYRILSFLIFISVFARPDFADEIMTSLDQSKNEKGSIPILASINTNPTSTQNSLTTKKSPSSSTTNANKKGPYDSDYGSDEKYSKKKELESEIDKLNKISTELGVMASNRKNDYDDNESDDDNCEDDEMENDEDEEPSSSPQAKRDLEVSDECDDDDTQENDNELSSPSRTKPDITTESVPCDKETGPCNRVNSVMSGEENSMTTASTTTPTSAISNRTPVDEKSTSTCSESSTTTTSYEDRTESMNEYSVTQPLPLETQSMNEYSVIQPLPLETQSMNENSVTQPLPLETPSMTTPSYGTPSISISEKKVIHTMTKIPEESSVVVESNPKPTETIAFKPLTEDSPIVKSATSPLAETPKSLGEGCTTTTVFVCETGMPTINLDTRLDASTAAKVNSNADDKMKPTNSNTQMLKEDTTDKANTMNEKTEETGNITPELGYMENSFSSAKSNRHAINIAALLLLLLQ